MYRRLATLLVFASLCGAMQKNGKSKVDVAIVNISCRRQVGDILLDGRLRIDAPRDVENMKLLIDIYAPGKRLISTKNGPIDPPYLEPGDEAEFHMRVISPARAVECRLRAVDGEGRELRVDPEGPFPIE